MYRIYDYDLPPMFCGRVNDSLVLPDSGYVCTPDGRVIFHNLTSCNYRPEVGLGPAFKGHSANGGFLVNASPIGAVDRECIFLGGLKNFGHFLFENILRLSMIDWVPGLKNLPVVVYDDLPRRFLEFLDCIGFGADVRIAIPRTGATQFSRIWFLSSPMYRNSLEQRPMVWPDAVHALRARLGSLLNIRQGSRSRLYIPRGPTAWRRLVNEPEVESLLARFGCTPIALETMTSADQVRAVANAEIIVAAMGAASAVTMFAPTDCAVIELSTPNITASFGSVGFAAILDQPFVRLEGRTATAEERHRYGTSANASIRDEDEDYVVDCAILTKLITAADKLCRKQAAAVL